MNLLQSVGALLQQGLPLNDLLNAISDFPGVPGRMQLINILDSEYSSRLTTVLVDYAHTPDALKNTLFSLRPLTKGKLICLFGCGGDRDRGKRAQMGEVASIFSDKLVITSDNPRFEDPKQILNDIIPGISNTYKMIISNHDSLILEEYITGKELTTAVISQNKKLIALEPDNESHQKNLKTLEKLFRLIQRFKYLKE